MTKRIVTAAVGIPLLMLVILRLPIWVSGLMMGLLCAGAAVEFMRCVNPELKIRVAAAPTLSAFVMPLWLSLRGEGASLYTISYWLFFALFIQLIHSFREEKRLDLHQIMAGLAAGAVMPILLSSLIRIELRGALGRLNMLLPFVIAFSCDGGAFFIGRAIGRRKLAPHLSPNKTREGAAGGILCGTAGSLLYGAVLTALGYRVRFALLAGYGLLGSVFCELGDLSFSAAKRICGIKDYGDIIPGHGGVLDRFDSMYFTAPLLEILTFWFPAILLTEAL